MSEDRRRRKVDEDQHKNVRQGRGATYRNVKVLQLFAFYRCTKRVAILHHIWIADSDVCVPINISLVDDSFGIHGIRRSFLNEEIDDNSIKWLKSRLLPYPNHKNIVILRNKAARWLSMMR